MQYCYEYIVRPSNFGAHSTRFKRRLLWEANRHSVAGTETTRAHAHALALPILEVQTSITIPELRKCSMAAFIRQAARLFAMNRFHETSPSEIRIADFVDLPRQVYSPRTTSACCDRVQGLIRR
jgi:hypothetical protein